MATKLDQSLDDIVKTQRDTNRRGRGRRAPRAGRTTATAAPSGGVAKSTRSSRTTTTPAGPKGGRPVVPITGSGESKIIVSGLPSDVTEQQIKDYFSKTIGPVKRVFLTYGPNGQSRGVSTIVFNKPGSALEAATQLNGVSVDGRPMKIEVVVGANQAPVTVPPKALGDRVSQSKKADNTRTKPKPAAASAGAGAATANATRGGRRGRGRGGRNAGRGKPKTAEELDAEMVDYFDAPAGNGAGATAANGTNGATQVAPATGGDTGMEDEIM